MSPAIPQATPRSPSINGDGTGDESAGYRCPACGSTLFGWAALHDPRDRSVRIVLDRCERCGLAVTRAPGSPDPDAELNPLLSTAADGRVTLEAANRRSLGGWLGGAGWAALEPDRRRLHLSPESARLLLAKRGLEAGAARTPYSASGARLLKETLINAFTLREDFLRHARAGELPEPETARERWLVRLDYAVSYLVMAPCALLAYPLERLAAAVGRGGIMRLEARGPGAPRG